MIHELTLTKYQKYPSKLILTHMKVLSEVINHTMYIYTILRRAINVQHYNLRRHNDHIGNYLQAKGFKFQYRMTRFIGCIITKNKNIKYLCAV